MENGRLKIENNSEWIEYLEPIIGENISDNIELFKEEIYNNIQKNQSGNQVSVVLQDAIGIEQAVEMKEHLLNGFKADAKLVINLEKTTDLHLIIIQLIISAFKEALKGKKEIQLSDIILGQNSMIIYKKNQSGNQVSVVLQDAIGIEQAVEMKEHLLNGMKADAKLVINLEKTTDLHLIIIQLIISAFGLRPWIAEVVFA